MAMSRIRRWHDRVAAMGCICCRLMGRGSDTPATIHHIREGEAAGGGQRADDALVVPLCPDCHQGSKGVHGDKTYLRIIKCTELDLLALVIRELAT